MNWTRSRKGHGQKAETDELRIVLIGRTGVGKSASGNTILGQTAFLSQVSASSVTSHCHKSRGETCGRKVAVIDTPGLFDTRFSQDVVLEKVKLCISLCAPGPHAFLVVLSVGRFTKEESDTVEMIQQTFGPGAAQYTIVLFTHGEELMKTTIQEYIRSNKQLAEFIDKCHGRHHVFNNNVKSRDQVIQLLDKVERMVKDNGGGYHTNEKFQEAKEAIEQEVLRLLRENKEKRREEEKEMEARLKGRGLSVALEEYRRKQEQEAIEKAEKSNAYLKRGGYVLAATAMGAIVGVVSSPVGAIVGAGVGAMMGLKLLVADVCITQ